MSELYHPIAVSGIRDDNTCVYFGLSSSGPSEGPVPDFGAAWGDPV